MIYNPQYNPHDRRRISEDANSFIVDIVERILVPSAATLINSNANTPSKENCDRYFSNINSNIKSHNPLQKVKVKSDPLIDFSIESVINMSIDLSISCWNILFFIRSEMLIRPLNTKSSENKI